jgi:hypothetical protein
MREFLLVSSLSLFKISLIIHTHAHTHTHTHTHPHAHTHAHTHTHMHANILLDKHLLVHAKYARVILYGLPHTQQ